MLLSQTAEYALRAMSCLALQPDGAPISSRQLSAHTAIPGHYLSKVMRRLVVAELVDSQRGHGGGFRLAKPPGAIRFLDILEAVDYRAELGRCAFGMGQCDPDNPCPLHDSWSEMVSRFESWARTTSLQSITESGGVMPLPASAQ